MLSDKKTGTTYRLTGANVREYVWRNVRMAAVSVLEALAVIGFFLGAFLLYRRPARRRRDRGAAGRTGGRPRQRDPR
ncbi:MAG: hypothetical protein Q7J25_12985 [Vicinamibacterales bacterium]|nr:hypothetical protein [Vicinamibacterales bacterium]